MPEKDFSAADICRARWNSIAKPVGSLGRLEEAVIRIAALTGDARVNIDKRGVIVMCADNGVLAQGVAQTDGSVTALMARLIATGDSCVCKMSQKANADVIPVDIGMTTLVDAPSLLGRRIANGTADMTLGPAMTREQAECAINAGRDIVRECAEKGYRILATGEMGIGNTTTSSAIASVLLNRCVHEMTGRGAGLTDDGLRRKLAAIEKAIEINRPDPSDAVDTLSKVGGFDIAGLVGVYLGGYEYKVPIIIDGFISAVSALVASRIEPECTNAMLASHLSAEPAAAYVLDALGLTPLLTCDMRLGEGTGAVCALPLLDMALAVYDSMPTFSEIGVSTYASPAKEDQWSRLS